jgi:hypothetical protein
LESLGRGRDGLAVLVDHFRIGHFVLPSVSVLDITNRALGLAYVIGKPASGAMRTLSRTHGVRRRKHQHTCTLGRAKSHSSAFSGVDRASADQGRTTPVESWASELMAPDVHQLAERGDVAARRFLQLNMSRWRKRCTTQASASSKRGIGPWKSSSVPDAEGAQTLAEGKLNETLYQVQRIGDLAEPDQRSGIDELGESAGIAHGTTLPPGSARCKRHFIRRWPKRVLLPQRAASRLQLCYTLHGLCSDVVSSTSKPIFNCLLHQSR